jgi:aspartyl/asparaginyl-tRNA synthetase
MNSKHFSHVVNKLRCFFLKKNYIEVHPQSRLSILAACEDPDTMTTFCYNDKKYPLPQTGQMWLEHELLKDPSVPGYFCVSTSYRNEPNPIPNRHELIFPMFEFELKGDFSELVKMELELLDDLGYGDQKNISQVNYLDMCTKYDTDILTHEHEQKMYSDFGKAILLKNFPESTSPFWNMKRNKNTQLANKIDVILSGIETIGSAERSCDVSQMKNTFKTISNGEYANTIYKHFGQNRVDQELYDFFSNKFITRSGGGIGITRLIRSMVKEKLI